MARSIHDVCLELVSSRSAPEEEEEEEEDWWVTTDEDESIDEEEEEDDHDSGILRYFAFLCYLARFALYFPPLSLRQQLPALGQLAFPSKLLRRFLRGCVVFTAHGLVIAPASVYVDAREKKIWTNRIFARVMSGFVVVPLQAAAAARIAGKSGVMFTAVGDDVSDDVANMLSYLIADANCVNERDG